MVCNDTNYMNIFMLIDERETPTLTLQSKRITFFVKTVVFPQ